jgi:hypothetical protein
VLATAPRQSTSSAIVKPVLHNIPVVIVHVISW